MNKPIEDDYDAAAIFLKEGGTIREAIDLVIDRINQREQALLELAAMDQETDKVGKPMTWWDAYREHKSKFFDAMAEFEKRPCDETHDEMLNEAEDLINAARASFEPAND